MVTRLPPEVLERHDDPAEHRRLLARLGNYLRRWVLGHESAANPHDQYLLETDALAVFAFAGYGGAYADPEIAMADIGLAWQPVPWNTLAVAIPRGIGIDLTSNTFTIANRGVYRLSISGSFEHNEANQGREMFLRFYNVTDATANPNTFRVPTGRNSPGSAVSWGFLVEVDASIVGKDFRLEVGGTTDSYTAVDWQGELGINNVGEWREPLPSNDP